MGEAGLGRIPRRGPEGAELASAQRQEVKGHQLRGNCWVEGWPAGAKPRSLDGLRLRLDLRFEPLEATKTEVDPRAEAAPVTATEPGIGPGRGFTQRIASRAVSIPRGVQALSVALGVGVVLVALAIWNDAAPPQQPVAGFPSPAASASRAGLPSGGAPGVAAGSGDGSLPPGATVHPAPSASGVEAARTAPAAVQNCPALAAERHGAGEAPGALARARARGRGSADAAPQHPILASTRREARTGASSAEDDLLYLFSDIR